MTVLPDTKVAKRKWGIASRALVSVGAVVAIIALMEIGGCQVVGVVRLFWHSYMFHWWDVSAKEELWGGYRLGEVFEIQRTCYILKEHEWCNFRTETRAILVPERRPGEQVGGMLYHPPRWTQGWTVSPGTKLKCTQLREYVGVGRGVAWFAEIQDGPHAGELVDLSDVSLPFFVADPAHGHDILDRPDLRLLKPVEMTEYSETPPVASTMATE